MQGLCYMIKAVLLDFGGVLFVDNNNALGPAGVLGAEELWAQARYGHVEDEVVFKEIASNYNTDAETVFTWLKSRRIPSQQLLDLLDRLDENIKLGVINNGLKSLFHDLMTTYDLEHRFNVLVNSAEEKVEKPDEDIYLIACQRLNVVPGDTLMVDDYQIHVEGAQQAGLEAVIYQGAEDLENCFYESGILKT